MKNILGLFLIFSYSYLSAQTISIPDPGFEQRLVWQNIDSDGEVNGQISVTDAESVISLVINGLEGPVIQNLTGIEAFVNLQELVVNWTEITELDVSQLTQLKILNCGSNLLNAINVTSNTLLEELYCGNIEADVGPHNYIEVVDLTNNPDIRVFYGQNMIWALQEVHLENGNNNDNMYIDVRRDVVFGPPPPEGYGDVCIFVDDTQAAQNNQFPYDNWEIIDSYVNYHFVDECTMSSKSMEALSFVVYPNPANDVLHIDAAGQAIDKLIMYDNLGRKVMEEAGAQELSVYHLAPGSYILKIVSGKRVQTKKIVVE